MSVVREKLVSTLVTVIFAWGSGAPVVSLALPRMVAVTSARETTGKRQRQIATVNWKNEECTLRDMETLRIGLILQ